MKNAISAFRRPMLSGLAFTFTVIAASVWYATYSAFTTGDYAYPREWGTTNLNATLWNKVIDNIVDIDARMSHFSFSGNTVEVASIRMTEIVTEGEPCVAEGTLSSSSGSTMLSCQSGFWKPPVVASGVRAWANFDGQNCVSTGCTIRSSSNIESVKRVSTGNYEVRFANPLPDALYAVVSTAEQAGGYNVSSYALSTTGFSLNVTYENAGPYNVSGAHFAVFR